MEYTKFYVPGSSVNFNLEKHYDTEIEQAHAKDKEDEKSNNLGLKRGISDAAKENNKYKNLISYFAVDKHPIEEVIDQY